MEIKTNQNMATLNRNTSLKENQVGREVLKDHLLLTRITKKENPKHDTEKDENRTRTHWRKAKRGYSVDQLAKHGWRWPKTPDGKMQNLHIKNWHK